VSDQSNSETSLNLADRISALQAAGEIHRQQGSNATDLVSGTLHASTAKTYEAAAAEMQKTLERIAQIDAATARLRGRLMRPPTQR
jgi:hypothetical protein